MYLDYNQIAADCKGKMQQWIGRNEIFTREWVELKRHKFPFDLPQGRNLFIVGLPIEIRWLDSSPLIELLKKKFGPERDVSPTYIDDVMDYAWSHILYSTSYVYGG